MSKCKDIMTYLPASPPLIRILTISNFLCLHFFKFIYLFIFYFCLCCAFIAAHGLSVVEASGGYSSLRCTGFSLLWLVLLRVQALGARASVVMACGLSSCSSQALEHRLSSCGARASVVMACGLSSCGSRALERRLSSCGAWA